jgi:hypothetical protein
MSRLSDGAIVGAGCAEANAWFVGAMAVEEETSGGLVLIPVATVGKAALRVVVRR